MWPEVEELYKEAQAKVVSPEKVNDDDPIWSIYGYLKVSKMLRRSFIQDAVFLKRDQPSHPLWQHCFFQSEAWKAWETRMFEEEEKAIQDMMVTAGLKTGDPEYVKALYHVGHNMNKGFSQQAQVCMARDDIPTCC